ncbi:hypothetical protein Pla22_41710 [Rubripirellula amarantea]|uniref:Uncharacterized protein n=1 Tax=Rubripirellula amarantea TaxID=2527999 RepID=A0A5C5WN17_9BACT|nr:hypothetical protein [Rubripirellula amarantea]TWT51393.1 hypothetical protein Pla22_41710 [Rubripirellula amarantea]
MPASLLPTPTSSTIVDEAYTSIAGLKDGISTLELFNTDPDEYARYLDWYNGRLDSRRLRNRRLAIETRLAAYLRLIGRRGQTFALGDGAIPSAKWLRDRLGLHRNTMGKYIKEAQANKPLQLSLTVGCQLAFAAAIYPPQTMLEKNAAAETLQNRLDLIDDYHLAGRDKATMVCCLTRITHTGENKLFKKLKSYPYSYSLDSNMLPLKLSEDHIPRRSSAKLN